MKISQKELNANGRGTNSCKPEGRRWKNNYSIMYCNRFDEPRKKVLFVDVDPQRNSTQFYGAETDGVKTMYDFYMDKCSIKEAIQNTKMGDIVPCDKLLKGMEGFLRMEQIRTEILSD